MIMKNNNSSRNIQLLLIVSAITLLILFTGIAYYLRITTPREVSLPPDKEQQPALPADNVPEKNNPAPTVEVSPTAKVPPTPLSSDQLTRLSQNLKIFKSTENDKLNGIENDFVYYQAGQLSQGELKDYSRIIAIKSADGPSQPQVFVLATKDYQNYFLDDPDGKTTKYPEDDWQNPYNALDKNKITATKIFDTDLPKEINLNQNFSLYSEGFPTESVETSKIDKNGNTIYDTLLLTGFSSYQTLTSPFKNFTIYFKPYETDTAYFNELTQAEKEKVQLKQQYLLGETKVIVVNSVGLPMAYSLTTPGNIKNYNDRLAQSPDYVYPPNMGFTSSKIISQNNLQFYSDYETVIPGACAVISNSSVVNVNDNDLEQIGSVFNLPLYRLKNTSHPLYTLAFKNKMDYYEENPAWWDQINNGIKKPTFEEYVNANPLLFVKDYWQRWVTLGEFDIKLPGGCGKPVVYLYPKQPTSVSVKFQAPIQFTTDIPKYADFWQVMAYPNGSLLNLKPELTDCRQIDSLKKGSEYAQTACQKNTYPYLYWAGNINSKNYPTVDQGWVISKNDLATFLQSKLAEVGLNDKEKNDFISYWLPDMLAKNTPYYRISFLQTNDLNSLFPMQVSPSPDTTFRLFLDYSPLTGKPQKIPQPQTLDKLVRNGFTLVEWGGLKQP
ncbi:MAG: hypothetical protein UV19_C0009G0001 [Parcubacteria group bacterium GW2011_GWA2_42_28]|nr:MAG: hypothetical protein UV19_C0009G0001 [Parcubacteria group bacterium GW2011_GWA2_42_28]KKT53962.1 MAG: hypothetical protein UW45_C0021G0001 [Parcubacteria group bacterium GW2011_GWC2_44_22]HCC50119.1 hypothetical protein [Candidatus Jacksonbacteria bacterium]